LVADNRVRVSGSEVTAVPVFDAERPTTALRAEVLARLPADLDELVVELATSGPARRIGARLVADGLLVAPRRRLVRAVLAPLPLVVLAVVAVLAGPTGWVTGAAVTVTGVLAVLLLLGPPPVLTRHGARAFAQATAGLAPVDPAEVTARYGLPRTAAPPAPHKGSARAGSAADSAGFGTGLGAGSGAGLGAGFGAGSGRRPDAASGTGPGGGPNTGQNAVFDGERVEPITRPGASDAPPPPRRNRAAVAEPRRWRRRNGWLVAGGWFAGGWLAGEYLVEDGREGGDGGGFVDPGSSGFEGSGGFGA
jgi:uncharacterized protein (TIGR04222 family)